VVINRLRSNRKALDLRDAIESSYEGALHTILTSALIMMILTAVMGFVFRNPAIGEICMTISKGAFSATVLVVFILLGILASLDKLICRKNKT
jgi:preprotein translocase subunit SecF